MNKSFVWVRSFQWIIPKRTLWSKQNHPSLDHFSMTARYIKPTSKTWQWRKPPVVFASRLMHLEQEVALEHTAKTTAISQLVSVFYTCMRGHNSRYQHVAAVWICHSKRKTRSAREGLLCVSSWLCCLTICLLAHCLEIWTVSLSDLSHKWAPPLIEHAQLVEKSLTGVWLVPTVQNTPQKLDRQTLNNRQTLAISSFSL